MQIAFINPISHLKYSSSNYQMALTHLALKYPEYVEHFKSLKARGDYIILDNSLIELGEAVGITDVLSAAELIKPDEIVLPDVFLNKDETLKSVAEAYNGLHFNGWLGDFKLQAVCHGKDDKEWKECWDVLQTMIPIDCIAVPKVTETIFEGGRPEAVRYALENNHGSKEIHLLGCWSDMSEIKEYTSEEKKLIRGMDTSLTFHSTIEGRSYIKEETKKPDYKIDLEKDYEIDEELLVENQLVVNHWLQDLKI